MPHKNYKIDKIEQLPNAEAEITGEIALPFLVASRSEALRHLNERADLSGFRKGKVPEDILVKKLGEMRVLEETAEVALSKAYREIIEEAKLSVVGQPHISITKMAPGIPLEFKIRVSLEPEFTLPDYKKIAQGINQEKIDTTITDKELEDVLKEVKERNINPELKEGETLEGKIRENLKLGKEHEAHEKKRQKLLDTLVKSTEITIPKVLVERELERMILQFKSEISGAGLDWQKYLEQVKKTEEEVRQDWREKALERVKAELILAKIALVEKIEPLETELEHETAHVLSHYPDADPLRARIYVYTQLKTQKVFEFLESIN